MFKRIFNTLITVITGVVFTIVAIAGWALSALGSIIHIWTIIIAFSHKGLLATIITACLPVIAEIYWFIKLWNSTGTLINPYCITLLAYFGLGIISLLALILTGLLGAIKNR